MGSLLYIYGTKADIALSVGQLSRHLELHSEEHCKAAIRVLRYMKLTSDNGISYRGGGKVLKVCAYSDADWVNSKGDRRSVSGIMIMISGAPLIFKSYNSTKCSTQYGWQSTSHCHSVCKKLYGSRICYLS